MRDRQRVVCGIFQVDVIDSRLNHPLTSDNIKVKGEPIEQDQLAAQKDALPSMKAGD